MRHSIAILAVLLCGAGLGFATQIFYTDTAIGSGTLGGNDFTDVLITVSYSGDTANIISGSGFFADPGGTATVTVAGLGTATFADVMEGGNIQGGGGFAFIEDVTMSAGVLGTINSTFSTYDLSTSIGPITGTSLLHAGTTSNPVYNTSVGSFIINSAGNSTFTADLATPEPGTFLLFGYSFAGILGYRLRRSLQQ